MKVSETLKELEELGTEQNRKIYSRHGVENDMYGVSYANLNELKKKMKRDHELARGLWASGNHDARVLATMIADPDVITLKELNSWVKDLDNYVITDAFTSLASQTKHARKKMEQWTSSSGEWTGHAGWGLLSYLAMNDVELPDPYFESYLELIESDIHNRKNRVRHAMNNALIAIGIRNDALRKRALEVAGKFGIVEVDHGETGCKTPDAADYIDRTVRRRRKVARDP
jgi:3-methyladenine DNA glycosylase AlkD